jgi:hypothetical protein
VREVSGEVDAEDKASEMRCRSLFASVRFPISTAVDMYLWINECIICKITVPNILKYVKTAYNRNHIQA